MYDPINANVFPNASVYNVVPWTKQGTAFVVGGSYTTVSGIPSQQLLASTNTTIGYFNGQMLARASGTTGAAPTTLTAGALVNFDPASTDTGQKVWIGWIICDPAMKFPLTVLTTYPGSIQVATPEQGWVIRQQYLYASGTPSTDAAIVQTAITTFGLANNQSQVMNSSGAYEVIFSY